MRKNDFFISVLIATYNRSRSLKDTLDSLLNQERKDNFSYEAIVIDNNSSDKTKSTIESYMEKFAGKLKYVFEPKQGKAYALNAGIHQARGEVLAFTDDDVIVDKKWLQAIYDIFQNEEVKCAGGKILALWDREKPLWYSDKIETVIPHIDYGNTERLIEYATGANMAVRKEVFEKTGLFEIMPAEDSIFSRKLRKDFVIWYFPFLIVQHKVLRERLNKRYFRQWYFKSGKSISKIRAQYPEPERKLLDVPLWMYKAFLKNVFFYFLNLYNSKERFFNELNSIRFLGFWIQRAHHNVFQENY